MTTTQVELARRFRELHRGGRILVLPNAWDVASARIFEAAGFPAVGTTSAGIAWSLGFPDGQAAPRALVLDAIRRIASAVAIPVTADVERGYGAGPADVAETVRAVIDAGAVGVNLEDGREGGKLASAERHVERIHAAREAAEQAGVRLFVNARTDVWFLPSDDPRAQVTETLRRAKLFVDAGADGLFAPGIAKPDAIAEVVRGAGCPVNVYAFTGVPPAPELQQLVVGRVSVGCGPMQATLGLTRRIATELREHGTWASMSDGALPVGELNALMTVDRRAAS